MAFKWFEVSAGKFHPQGLENNADGPQHNRGAIVFQDGHNPSSAEAVTHIQSRCAHQLKYIHFCRPSLHWMDINSALRLLLQAFDGLCGVRQLRQTGKRGHRGDTKVCATRYWSLSQE